jgi:hypothetical protein
VKSRDGIIDFAEQWAPAAGSPGEPPSTNDKVAYAYAEFDVERAAQGTARFGSDDSAKVWVNGKLVHRIAVGRALRVDDDHFSVPFVAGKNRVLIKVDNGVGGWGFALGLYDDAGAQRLKAIRARQELDFRPRPVTDRFEIENELPAIVIGNPSAYRQAFGDMPLLVRWFGPDLEPTERVGPAGRYIALLESTTRDGHRYQRMMSFTKLEGETTPWFSGPPYRELPELPPSHHRRWGGSLKDKPRTRRRLCLRRACPRQVCPPTSWLLSTPCVRVMVVTPHSLPNRDLAFPTTAPTQGMAWSPLSPLVVYLTTSRRPRITRLAL